MSMNTDPLSSNPNERARGTSLRSVLYLFVFLLITLITIAALAWTIENWRGARAWSAVKHELVARGEPLSFEQLVPPMPPSEQNFASTPLLRGLFDYGPTRDPGTDSFWRSPQGQARLRALALPPTRELRAGPLAARRRTGGQPFFQGRIDFMPYALGIRLRPRTAPPILIQRWRNVTGTCRPA